MHIYLIPLIFDYILYGIFFIVSFRMAESGSALLTGAPMAIWGITYAAVSFLLGKVVNSKNAVWILRFSGVFTAAVSLLFFIEGLYLQLIFIALMGVAGACFCTPFQIVAGEREDDSGGPPGKAAALYTFSLSLGPAVSPLVFGCFDVNVGFWINVLLGVVMTLLVTPQKKKSGGENNAAGETAAAPAGRMIPVWVFCGTAILIVSLLGMLQPFRAVEINLDRSLTGWAAALIKIPQALVALALIAVGDKLCRKGSIAAMTLIGVGGLIGMALASSAYVFLAGSCVWGIACGCFYMYFVYSALQDKERRAGNVSGNEMIQGICCIAGPAAGGVITGGIGSVNTFFVCALLMIAAAAAAMIIGHRKTTEIV